MATVTAHIKAPPEAIFAVLADGWSYSGWVVGTSYMRAVEDAWPSVGSRLFHASGVWPAVLADETSVEAIRRDERLVMTARGRPLGEARIVAVLGQVDDEVDGVGHQQVGGLQRDPLRGLHGVGGQLGERPPRRRGVQGGHRPIRPLRHGVQQGADFFASGLADDYPVGTHAQRPADQLGQADTAFTFEVRFSGFQRHHVGMEVTEVWHYPPLRPSGSAPECRGGRG
jgi:uncharacterized protein YndB with AHSA1/START domain